MLMSHRPYNRILMQQNKDKKVAVLLKASETNMHDTVSLSRLRGLKLAITFPANRLHCGTLDHLGLGHRECL